MKRFSLAVIAILFFIFIEIFFIDPLKKQEYEEQKNELSDSLKHEAYLSLPEGRYLLNSAISADSTKTVFTLGIPGPAKRITTELIAYEPHEWQVNNHATSIATDTVIIVDVWNNESEKFDRVIQKFDSNIGPGYVLGFVEWSRIRRQNKK